MAEQDNTQFHESTLIEDEGLSDASSTLDTPPSEQQQQQQSNHDKSIKLISRIISIPIIHDITNKTSLGRFAVSTAHSTLSTMNKYQPRYVQPYYEQYIQPHVEKVDELGCHSLDLIQKKYPLVNQPTSELLQTVTTPVERRMTPVVDSFQAALDRYLPPGDEIHETNQAVRAYYLLNNAPSRIAQRRKEMVRDTVQKLQALQAQLVTLAQHSFVVQKTQEKITQLKSPLHARLVSILQITQQQLQLVREQYDREDIQTIEKAKQIAVVIQNQILQLLEQLKAHYVSSH